MCSFCKDQKERKKKKICLLFILLLRCYRKLMDIGNIDSNVCELRLVGMSIQSTVQGLRSQSSCLYFDFMDRPNVFDGSVTFG